MTTISATLSRGCHLMRACVRRTGKDRSIPWSHSALASTVATICLHQHMKKPCASPMTYHQCIYTLWMFTCQSTLRMTLHTCMKTHATPVRHPLNTWTSLPHTRHRVNPGYCFSDGPRIWCQAKNCGSRLLLEELRDLRHHVEEQREGIICALSCCILMITTQTKLQRTTQLCVVLLPEGFTACVWLLWYWSGSCQTDIFYWTSFKWTGSTQIKSQKCNISISWSSHTEFPRGTYSKGFSDPRKGSLAYRLILSTSNSTSLWGKSEGC